MFTGLVQYIGRVRSVKNQDKGLRLEIETQADLSNVQIGASVCCSGCCLTVTDKTKESFFADLSSETLQRTKFSTVKINDTLNLEFSLKLGDELGGHFVFGHVDSTAEILKIEKIGDCHRIDVKIPVELSQFIAGKGSITLDGVSLTVNFVNNDIFSVNIIPHTLDMTTLSELKAGSMVNLEIDMLARYVHKMLNVKKD